MKKFDVICFGEVLWDMLPTGARVGGAPLNVCYHLHKNGVSSGIISQVGKDSLGDSLMQAIGDLGVDKSFIHSTDQVPTSVVEVSLVGEGTVAYTIVEGVAWDYIPFDVDIALKVAEASYFVFGSLVARSPQSAQTLMSYLAQAKWPVMDMNLRAPFYNTEQLFVLISHCRTLKINEDELGLLLGWIGCISEVEEEGLEAILSYFSQLQEIIVTKGAAGSCYYSQEEYLQQDALKIQVKDTVGAGDSFLAAFLAGRIQGKSVEESMQEARSLSAYVAQQAGACPDYK